ncbi:MAG TPA: glutamate-5-semialdehyde dehydrogenase [Bacilli bacterium]|jgi:glutamate-5-semialdehyde dehydrogenase|nr:glutamate-5-semialdehyde dehydrogenase [Acholeplasmataceae bacterium]HNZ78127.1 glutamate-5-semialdehyde dehydrogenase [Bacilli bacterium]HOD61197.1 glutamate-5-semialdehyde dehydrogenase [Bacilli bacterium]HOH61984.1 glutamate-5-semialdehyde dehydrogenase [Bacilli bacterium]HPB49409.1 glutamate-5-semialdehyde dehydrogenase [Bacilli bacterium]
MERLNEMVNKAKNASRILALKSSQEKDEALKKIAQALLTNTEKIIASNKIDLKKGKEKGLSKAMLDRLELTPTKIAAISSDILKVVSLKDPIGEEIETIKRPNGLIIKKIRVPFGVICAIYESRPNVSVDIACLSIKTGNACILKGGSEAINSNRELVKIMQEAIKPFLPLESIVFIDSSDRNTVNQLITMKGEIDLVIPRGGKGLIQHVLQGAQVPVIETGAGNCHAYVHKDANLSMAEEIIVNAKVSRPSVCNAIETVLVDKEIADKFLPIIASKLRQHHVVIKGCQLTKAIIDCELIEEEDFYEEYNDYIIRIKVVNDYLTAIKHINQYGTNHSDVIISENEQVCEDFLNRIDSACVYVNASTRFTDGGEFGFGAELGISTQKLHARGPMGLKEMTSYKYKIYGKGQIRI